MTLADHFTYGTWEVRKNAKETMKRLGYRYGHLVLLRTDFQCGHCDELHECWSVANLVSGTYPFPGSIFQSIDDGMGYIYEITPLAKWDTINIRETAKLAESLINICLKYNGVPIKLLGLLIGDPLKGGVAPGTVTGLNGYTKQ